MKAPPRFWRRDGMAPRILSPIGAATAGVTARRMTRQGLMLEIPVICAGNAGLGGAGKTIVALDILRRLQARGRRPYALTRGYQGRLAGPLLADPLKHDAADIGDEALLLAAAAPTIVAKDRAAGGRLARKLGADAIVMDDGLQNPGLAKTLSFLVIDGGSGFGNGHCIPAGPLREPVSRAAERCQAAVLIGEDSHGARDQLPPELPVLTARLRPDAAVPLAGQRVIGFAGIGRPEKFFDSLRDLGAVVVRGVAFSDHHNYRATELTRLEALAYDQDALLATTGKDAVKLPAAFRLRCIVVGIGLDFDDPAALEALLP